MSPSTGPYTLSLLPPPGPTVLCYLPPSLQPFPQNPSRTIPPLFTSAISIRDAVFVLEQHCSAISEIDADDAVSWHWVLHTPGAESVPAATVRLVPYQRPHHFPAKSPTATLAVEGPVATEPDYTHSTLWNHHEAFVKIGRLATLPAFRGRGYGRVLVEALLGYARAHAAEMVLGGGEGEGERWQGLVLVHAQVGVEGWYTSLGFERDEGMGVWVEEGIGHVGMWRRVEVGGDGGGEGGF